MFKILISLLFLLPSYAQHQPSQPNDCNCLQVANLQKSGKASGAVTISWSGNAAASCYTLKYVRQSDGYTSPEISEGATSHTFSGLPAGNYVFYVATICGNEKSSFIGVEDLVEN